MNGPHFATMMLCAGMILGANGAAVPAPFTPAPVTPLFNGTNLASWTIWLVDTKRTDPRRVFTVTNGTIRISDAGLGYLATTNSFRDYRLVVEYKWGTTNTYWGDRIGKARDSGVFLHATGPDGNSHDGHGGFMAALECNVFQGATGDLLLIRGTNVDGTLIAPRVSYRGSERRDADGFRWYDPSGSWHRLERWGRVNWRDKSADWQDELNFRGARDVEKAKDWNRLEIMCAAANITVHLNGQLVNAVTDAFPAAGKILLQCEGSEIFFRRVELQPLGMSRE